MRDRDIIFSIYLVVILSGVVLGLVKYRHLDVKAKIMLVYITVTFLNESFVQVLTKVKTGLAVNIIETRITAYYFYSVASFCLIVAFFIKNIKPKKESMCMYASVSVILLLGAAYYIHLMPLQRFNSNVLIVKSFTSIALSLYALYKILIDDDKQSISKEPDFWFSVIFLFLYSCTFFFWACFIMLQHDTPSLNIAQNIQDIINNIVYAAFGLVFFLYPKKTTA